MVKNIFLSIFGWILNCYNNSVFEKISLRVANALKKGFFESRILNFFRSLKKSGHWSQSTSAKIVRSPFAMCRGFYHKYGKKIEKFKTESAFFRFWPYMGQISAKDYASLLLALGTGMLFAVAVLAKWTNLIYIAITAFVIFLGIYLSFADFPIGELVCKSKCYKIIKKTFLKETGTEKKWDKKRIPQIAMVMTAAIVLGFVTILVEPLGIVIGIFAAVALLAILAKPIIGVFLFVPLSAILPTMALVGIIAITAVSYILHLLFDKNASYISTPFQPLISIFVGLILFSAFTSVAFVSSLKILFIYLIFTFAYVLIVNNIKSKAQWKGLVVLFVLAATLVALYGIYQNFFVTQTAQGWVDGDMFEDIKTRVYSTLDNPNVLGQYLIMMVPIAFAMLIAVKERYNKALYFVCNCLMLVCLIYTWSRGAWLGVVIGIAFFVLLKDRRWLVVCIAALFIMPSVLPTAILNRLLSVGDLEDSSTAYRVAVWLGSLNLLKDYWFTGIGLGSDAFLKIYPQYALGGADFALHSHNFYLQWIVDMGFMGLVTYIGILVTGFSQIASVKEKNSVIKNVLLAMAGGLAGYIFHGMAENLWYNYRMILVFWCFFGILQSGVMLSNDNIQKGDITK